ncbi:MAG: MarR family transcriptional regulator [Ruminococcaceae bacterium]|nr:MarR family transcriptional regulator [Oscillospiraceae bacterium]
MHDVSQQMMAMQSLLMRRLMKGLEDTGVSTGQPKVLAYLNSHEGKPQKEIAAACMLEPGSLTVLLNRMEKQGMIERGFREGDRRTRRVYLTDHGRALAARVIEEFYAVESLAFRGIPDSERALFLRVCGEVLENLGGNDEANK